MVFDKIILKCMFLNKSAWPNGKSVLFSKYPPQRYAPVLVEYMYVNELSKIAIEHQVSGLPSRDLETR